MITQIPVIKFSAELQNYKLIYNAQSCLESVPYNMQVASSKVHSHLSLDILLQAPWLNPNFCLCSASYHVFKKKTQTKTGQMHCFNCAVFTYREDFLCCTKMYLSHTSLSKTGLLRAGGPPNSSVSLNSFNMYIGDAKRLCFTPRIGLDFTQSKCLTD